jgi:plasmid segregation protein ParM
MEHTILSVDPGNHGGKTVGLYGYDYFKTNICDWFERNVGESFGNDDMEFEIDGRKGYAGPIATYENEFGASSMFGDSKAHEDAKIRVLLCISRYLDKFCPKIQSVSIITSQPITGHTELEKEKIIEMLMGDHRFMLNGVERKIKIKNVKVAAEGSVAYWSADLPKDLEIIDIGSGTVNAAKIRDKKHINAGSDTFNFGTETVRNKEDFSAIARGIALNISRLKWERNSSIFVCGGIAKDVLDPLKKHYVNAQILTPKYKQKTKITIMHPVFANAVGMFELAKRVYK